MSEIPNKYRKCAIILCKSISKLYLVYLHIKTNTYRFGAPKLDTFRNTTHYSIHYSSLPYGTTRKQVKCEFFLFSYFTTYYEYFNYILNVLPQTYIISQYSHHALLIIAV